MTWTKSLALIAFATLGCMSESANPKRNLVKPLLAPYPTVVSNAPNHWVIPTRALEARRVMVGSEVDALRFDAPRGSASPARNSQREPSPAPGREMTVASKLDDVTASDSNSDLPNALGLRRGEGGIVVDVPF